MRPWGIIDWLEVIALVQSIGFLGLLVLVALLFRQHDQSVLAELKKLNDLVKGILR